MFFDELILQLLLYFGIASARILFVCEKAG